MIPARWARRLSLPLWVVATQDRWCVQEYMTVLVFYDPEFWMEEGFRDSFCEVSLDCCMYVLLLVWLEAEVR